jgi:hypothetical protein
MGLSSGSEEYGTCDKSAHQMHVGRGVKLVLGKADTKIHKTQRGCDSMKGQRYTCRQPQNAGEEQWNTVHDTNARSNESI